MKVSLDHPSLGRCLLTDEHSASSYGQPVLQLRDGTVLGPGEVLAGDLTLLPAWSSSRPQRDWLEQVAAVAPPLAWPLAFAPEEG